MIATQEQTQVIQELIAWVAAYPTIRQQLLNGVARGLYPGVVAEIATQRLDNVEEALKQNLLTTIQKEA